jgi:hypothetical protein
MPRATLTSCGMALRIGRHTFHFTTYDPPSDVLDAGLEGPPNGRRERSPEDHVWRLDDEGRLVGITFMNPRRQLERDGAVYVTLPSGERERVAGAEAMIRREAAGG